MLTELHFIANTTAAVTETTLDGKSYLIAPVVMIKEGVLNGLLYLADDLAINAQNWNGRPVSLGHPTRNGEYISANSPDVWANQVPGQLWNVTADAQCLKGEIWIDLEKAARIGGDAMKVVAQLRANQPTEVSTGLFAETDDVAGIYNGVPYTGIARNIFSDHLALLPGEIGACSWEDGCGVPRINKKGDQMEVQANVMTLDDKASVVRRAFWSSVTGSQMGDVYDGEWDVISVFDDVVVAKDWNTKAHTAFPYTIDEAGAVTLGAPSPVDVVYRQKQGGAEVVVANQNAEQKPMSLIARAAQWLRGEKSASDKEETVVVEQGQLEANVTKCELVANLLANKANKFSKETLDAWSEKDLEILKDTLRANEEAEAATQSPAQTVQTEPKSEPEWKAAFDALTAKIDGLTGTIQANVNQERDGLVQRLVANERCVFDAKELAAMPLPQLQKIASMLDVRDYSGGAGTFFGNGQDDDELTELPMPVPTWMVKKEDK